MVSIVTFDGSIYEVSREFKNQVNKFLEENLCFFRSKVSTKQNQTLNNAQRLVLLGLYFNGLSDCDKYEILSRVSDSKDVYAHFSHCLTVNRDSNLLFQEMALLAYKQCECVLEEIYAELAIEFQNERNMLRKGSAYETSRILKEMNLIQGA